MIAACESAAAVQARLLVERAGALRERPRGEAERLGGGGAVVGFRRDTDVGGRPLVEPPEEFGDLQWAISATAGGDVERLRLDQSIRLLPETYLARVADQPAVADDAVFGCRLAREQRRLGGAGDGGQHLAQRPHPAGPGEGAQARGERQQARRQADGVDEDEGHHGSQIVSGSYAPRFGVPDSEPIYFLFITLPPHPPDPGFPHFLKRMLPKSWEKLTFAMAFVSGSVDRRRCDCVRNSGGKLIGAGHLLAVV